MARPSASLISASARASALRATIKGNRDLGREVRRRFDIDEQHACEVTKVAPASHQDRDR